MMNRSDVTLHLRQVLKALRNAPDVDGPTDETVSFAESEALRRAGDDLNRAYCMAHEALEMIQTAREGGAR